MANKVKVPGGAFYLGDGLTVDPVTKKEKTLWQTSIK